MRKKKTQRVRSDTTTKKKRVYKKKVTRKPKVPRTRNMGTLTESEFFGKIRSALRRTFRYWKPMQEALKQASRPSQNKENKRLKTEYQCAKCKQWFGRKGVEIDHKIPAGSLRSFEDIVPFLKNLTTEDVGGYQILCIKDHKTKTGEDNDRRKLEREKL